MSKQSQIAALQSQAASVEQQKAGYAAKVQEIKKIYDELSKLKNDFNSEKTSLNTLKNEDSNDWTGNLYKTQFKQPVGNLVEKELNKTITAIDTNMDRLIDKMNEYENKIYELDGLLGHLASMINNILGTIEKWIN